MRVEVGAAAEVGAGRSKKFVFVADAMEVEAFVVNVRGALHAYVNRCRHVPMSLDWVENRFFTADGRFVQCATHGAYYRPETGECVAGPPCGRTLIRVPLRIEGTTIVADCPSHLPDD